MSKWPLVKWALIIEGSLAAVFLVWYCFNTLPESPYSLAHQLIIGVLAILPLLAVNAALFGPWAENISWLRSCIVFRDTIVKPLADQLNYKDAAIISVTAGVGEELFFRGMLQNEIGLAAASILFAIVHFGAACIRFRIVTVVYLAVGFYLGFLYYFTASLITVITAHALYDWVALLALKRLTVAAVEEAVE